MPDDYKCPACGAVIPPEASGGQCVNCLLSLGLSRATLNVKYFGDYELKEIIAEGGMGVVYRARQVSLNRRVALKMIRAGQFAMAAEVERFRVETEAAANLEHANIVPIYEVGQYEGQPYFSMKLVEGRDLDRRIADGEFQFGPADGVVSKSDARKIQFRIATILAKVARAVHFAHQRQILHRDLKPSNVILDERDEPYVVDFGLAKLLEGTPGATRTRQILGTAEYMSPEQARVEKWLTTGTDIYSLGALLYHLITGRPPFHGGSQLETLQLVIDTEPVPTTTVNPFVDCDLETICLKCLEKDPIRRYSSAETLAEDLERWLVGKPITARPIAVWERAIKWVKREPYKAGLALTIACAVPGLFMLTEFYRREAAHTATEHPVVTHDVNDVYWLPILVFAQADRCTYNFWRGPFSSSTGRLVRIEFSKVPPELLPSLRCQIRADQAGRPDPPRSPILRHGETFRLKVESRLDRDFYVTSVGWYATNLLPKASNAAIQLTILPEPR